MNELRCELMQDEADSAFNCGVPSINEYVYNSYYPSLLQHCFSYSIFYGEKVVGYYMLMIRKYELDLLPDEISDYRSGLCEDICTLHIKYLAISKQYQKHHVGNTVMQSIIKYAKQICDIMPIRLLTIDALPHLVEWYKKLGFKEIGRNKSCQEGYTVFMYIDFVKEIDKIMEYAERYYQ